MTVPARGSRRLGCLRYGGDDQTKPDLAAGRRSLRGLTVDEYDESRITDTIDLSAALIWIGGWIPVGIVAIIVVAFVSGDQWLFPLTALAARSWGTWQ